MRAARGARRPLPVPTHPRAAPLPRPSPTRRSNTYGYSRLTFYNSTHLLFEQVQTDNGQPATTGTVIDAYLHVQTAHGPFAA